jgi:hypothetical protein
MTRLLHDAAAATSFAEINTLFLETFQSATAGGDLAAFRADCAALVADPPNAVCLPHAFAYEARSYLHDYNLWEPPTADTPFRPRPALLDALDRCLDRPQAVNCRDNYYWLIIAGLRAFVSDDVQTAFRQFALAAAYPDFYRVVRCDLGGGAAFARTYPTPAELAALRAAPKLTRTATFVCEFAQTPRLVISTGFDRLYGLAFARDWIQSVARLAPQGVGLHLHAMFRGAADLPLIESWQAEAAASGLALAVSVESEVTQSNAYYASARFLKGGAALRRFGCPLLTVDADAFIPDIDRFRDVHLPLMLAETRILGLLSDGPWNGYLPWRRFSAGWILFPHSEAGQAFLDTTADCIDYFWDSRGHNWWIDQVGLEVGRRVVSQACHPAPVFGQIYSELPNLFDTGEDHKIRSISRLPEIARRIEAGMSYWEAIGAADLR